jgi:hypothetical protein
MAMKIKNENELKRIYEDLKTLFNSETVDKANFYRYLEQIKSILEQISKKEIKLLQKLHRQKYRKERKIRKEKEIESYLFRSRYQGFDA